MKHTASFLWLSALVLLCGCGGGQQSITGNVAGMPGAKPPDPKPHALDTPSNWQFSTASTVAGAPALAIAGSLSPDGGGMSGAVHVDGSNCFDRLATLELTGTLTNRNLSLTSAPVNGQVITFSGSLSDGAVNGSASAFTGTYTISGGCANGDQGSVTGIKVPPIPTGLSATFTSSGEGSFELTAGENQSSSPSATGSFAIQGTVTVHTSCFTSGTLTPGTFPTGSFILGTSVALQIATDNGTVNFLGTLDPNTGEIDGNYTVSGGTCDQTGTATLFTSSPWDY
ncbi:MAG TPA: hypothetical protein VHS34_03390 [Terriglobales bacterium]|nr:hypothetical protein [Terriglobales bacterium]